MIFWRAGRNVVIKDEEVSRYIWICRPDLGGSQPLTDEQVVELADLAVVSR